MRVKNKRTRVVVVLEMRVLCRKWEMADYQNGSLIWWSSYNTRKMMMRYAPFNWGLSFMAVPIPIMMPSCIVRILSCVTSILSAEGVQ